MPQPHPLPSRSVAQFSSSVTTRHPGSNPFLSALECDFRHPDDGRKWFYRCGLKRQVCRGYAKLGLNATERRLSRFLGIPAYTIRRVIRILIKQGFVSNVRRRWHGPVLRRFHVERLRQPFAFEGECARVTPGEYARIKTPRSLVRRSSGFDRLATSIPQELGKTENRATNRRSSVPLFSRKSLLPQQERYSRIGRIAAAAELLFPRGVKLDVAAMADALKWYAAKNGIEYSDTPAGLDDPIEKAIKIFEQRRGDPLGRFAAVKRRE